MVIINNNAIANGAFTNSIKVTVKDVFGQAVVGEKVLFSASNGAAIVDSGGETDATGSVTALVTSMFVGASDVTAKVNSSTMQMRVNFIVNAFSGVYVNGHTFRIDEGFPTTAFAGASFQLRLPAGSPREFDWRSNSSSASVDSDGRVTLSRGNSSSILITATPKLGGGSMSYRLRIATWFIPPTGRSVIYADAVNTCIAQGGRIPNLSEFTQGYGKARSKGTLFQEWGDLTSYNVGFTRNHIWLVENTVLWVSDPSIGNLIKFTGRIDSAVNRASCVLL